MPKNIFEWIAVILILIGGLNWGLVGALNFNLVDLAFGNSSIIAKIIYILVGMSALYGLFFLFKKQSQELKPM